MPNETWVKTLKALYRTLLRKVWRPEVWLVPDVPIPAELQPPQEWAFNLEQALKAPTVWDVLHTEETLWLLQMEGISVLSMPSGLALMRVPQIWHDTSTPENEALLERVRYARAHNQRWRLEMDMRRADMVRQTTAAEDTRLSFGG